MCLIMSASCLSDTRVHYNIVLVVLGNLVLTPMYAWECYNIARKAIKKEYMVGKNQYIHTYQGLLFHQCVILNIIREYSSIYKMV